jgi:glycosyltransferase involved in cell wall biosynthesis
MSLDIIFTCNLYWLLLDFYTKHVYELQYSRARRCVNWFWHKFIVQIKTIDIEFRYFIALFLFYIGIVIMSIFIISITFLIRSSVNIGLWIKHSSAIILFTLKCVLLNSSLNLVIAVKKQIFTWVFFSYFII